MTRWIVDILDADDEFIREFRCDANSEQDAKAQAENDLRQPEFLGDAVEVEQ